MATISKNYGYIKDAHDPRDFKIKFTDEHVKSFSVKHTMHGTIFDLRKIVTLPDVLNQIDQGKLGSCTANAIAFAYVFDQIKQGNKEIFFPSRLFIYYNERLIEGTVNEDSGAQIRDGIKSLNSYGVCDEHHWIYDPTKFNVKPSKAIYAEAKLSKAVHYTSIDFSSDKTDADRVKHLKNALKSGFPFVFGFTVYDSFESSEVASTGMMPMPAKNEEVVGGHAVCCVGFDDDKQCFIVKNSWGADWGDNSYFYMPYEYMSNTELTDDFWVIRQVSNPNNIPNFDKDDISPDATNLDVDINNGGGVVNNTSPKKKSCHSKCLII